MKKFKRFSTELPIIETILLGKSIQMGDRRARIVKVVSIGGTSRYDTVYKVKFQDGTQVEMHDSQIRPFLIEEGGAGEEATDELDDTYREDTPGEEVEERAMETLTFEFPDDRKAAQFDYDIENSSIGIGDRVGNKVTVTGVQFKWRAGIKKYMKKSRGKLVNESVELDEALTLASDEINPVKKSAQKLANQSPDRTYYVVQHTHHHGGGKIKYRYEVVDSVDMHMYRDAKRIAQYGKIKESVDESTPTNAVGGGMSPHFGGEGPVQGYDPILGKKKKKKRKKFAGAEVFELNSDDYHTCMHGRKRYERWNRKLNMENIDNQEIRDYAHKNPGAPIVIQDKTTGVMAYLIHGDKK